ncbi:MAG: SIS domain-containing protein [Pseudomonadota bacterium]
MLDRIQAALSSLSPSEQRVAKLCLTDPREFSGLAVSELARQSRVSKPTVVRFCRSVGFDGLLDFKRKLSGTVHEGAPFIHRCVDVDDKTHAVAIKVIDSTTAALLKYRSDINMASMEQAAETLVEAYRQKKRVQFYGVGDSGVVAHDAQHKFFRLGLNTVACGDSHFQIVGASVLEPGDCAVFISNSGRTRDLMEACNIARKNGASMVVIAASKSPLASAAHIHLAADHGEAFEYYVPMVSRLLHLLIIDILVTCVALRIGCSTLQPLMRNVKDNLRNKRYA